MTQRTQSRKRRTIEKKNFLCVSSIFFLNVYVRPRMSSQFEIPYFFRCLFLYISWRCWWAAQRVLDSWLSGSWARGVYFFVCMLRISWIVRWVRGRLCTYVKSKMTINLTMLLFEGAAGGPVKGDARLRIIQGSKSKTGDAR